MRRRNPCCDETRQRWRPAFSAHATSNGSPPRTVAAHWIHRSSICFGPAWSETLRQTLTGMQSESPHRTAQHVESQHSIQPEVAAQPVTTREIGFDAARRNSVPGRRRLAAIQALCASAASRPDHSQSVCDRCDGSIRYRHLFFSVAACLTPEDRWRGWPGIRPDLSETH